MEKFFGDLEKILQEYNDDVTVLDDYEIEEDFIMEVMSSYYSKQRTKVLSIHNSHVFDGPNVSSISISLSIRFDVKILPDYNIEDIKKVNIFVKIPIFENLNEASRKLCSKEVRVYDEFFKDLKEFHDHPIKGPFTPPTPTVIFQNASSSSKPSILVLSNVSEEGFYSPRERFLDKNELRSVIKTLAKFHADGIKYLRDNKNKEYDFLQVCAKTNSVFTSFTFIAR